MIEEDQVIYEKHNVNRIMRRDIDTFLAVAKALSTELRVEILKRILAGPIGLSELAEAFELPLSTIATNVKRLEETGLIRTDVIPGSQGSKKLCSCVYTGVFFEFNQGRPFNERAEEFSMPVGAFTDCSVKPSCGMLSHEKIIGEFDDPASFYEPERMQAQLIWFRGGYVEYRFPKHVRDVHSLKRIEFSLELCSEAPMHRIDWPSDITLWINGVEIGTWTSPSDFGGERGILTPEWWGDGNTQYGVFKTWSVCEDGSYIDGNRISGVSIWDVFADVKPYLSVRIGIKEDAVNDGGVNLFGRRFGNYETDLQLRIIYKNEQGSHGGITQIKEDET